MIVEGSYTLSGPRNAVWDLLQDPAVLAKVLPGAKRLDRVAEDQFEGEMSVGVGPVTAAMFSVRVTVADKNEPDSFSMQVEGKGPIGFTRGKAQVELTDQDGGTQLTYSADLKIGGKIAGVGQRLLDTTSKAMTKQGLEALNRELEGRLTGAPVAAPPARWPVVVGGTALILVVLVILLLVL